MIVVSDASPLNYLILLDAIDVLPKIFDKVLAPETVKKELLHPSAPPIVRAWFVNSPQWFQIAAPTARLPATAHLDQGEADAISLAVERNISTVLIDERAGRAVAVQQGLQVVPTLTVLERAAEKSLLDLPTKIEALLKTNFRVS